MRVRVSVIVIITHETSFLELFDRKSFFFLGPEGPQWAHEAYLDSGYLDSTKAATNFVMIFYLSFSLFIS